MAFTGDAVSKTNAIRVFTIGHSTHSYETFLSLLRTAEVTAIADVRSSPYSRHFPQFNRETLQDDLRLDGIAYVFLGDQLGGRPQGKKFYSAGVADYEKMAKDERFCEGLERVVDGAKKYRIALLCSEGNPLDCHRCLLVGRELVKRNLCVCHILPDGRIESQAEIDDKLFADASRDHDDLFLSREEVLAMAYRDRGRKVAYAEPGSDPERPIAAE